MLNTDNHSNSPQTLGSPQNDTQGMSDRKSKKLQRSRAKPLLVHSRNNLEAYKRFRKPFGERRYVASPLTLGYITDSSESLRPRIHEAAERAAHQDLQVRTCVGPSDRVLARNGQCVQGLLATILRPQALRTSLRSLQRVL